MAAGRRNKATTKLDKLDEKAKAQIKIWRLNGMDPKTLLSKIKEGFGLEVTYIQLYHWLEKNHIDPTSSSDVYQEFLEEILHLKNLIDSHIVLDVSPQKLKQLLMVLEVYSKVFKDIPKVKKKSKDMKELYDEMK